MREDSCNLPPSVGSASGPENVCNMWYDHYRTFFSSVPSSRDFNDGFISTHCDFVTDNNYVYNFQ